MIRFVIVILSLFLLEACNKESKFNKKALIEAEIQRKIERFKHIKREECLKNMLDEAKNHVDSLVLIEFNDLDTTASPQRPTRPVLDKKIILNDSTDISPIIND